MEIMAEDWVRLELGMHLQIGVLRYAVTVAQSAINTYQFIEHLVWLSLYEATVQLGRLPILT